jgi:tetratricopeptide (TPR) repeat protein
MARTGGVFCKHCVATALVWLDEASPDGDEPDEPNVDSVDDESLQAFLRAQPPDWLAEQLMQSARHDPLLRARLDVAAGGDSRIAYDDSELRGILVDAIAVDDFVHYRSARSYVIGVNDALGRVDDLIAQGFPDAAIELAEFTLDLLEEAINLVDDSDGGVGGVIRDAEAVHLAACHAGNPDRVELAERLATRALTSDWEVSLTAIPDYADVLGEDGMARYREIVEAAWRALPVKKPGSFQYEAFRPTFLMERLASFEGGTDAFIDVVARNASSSYDILRIAEALVEDGRDGEALEWVSRGLADYAPDGRLRSLAADCHLRAGRRDAALELLWSNFEANPSLGAYQRMHGAAGDTMTAWRSKALTLLRQQPRADARRTAHPWAEPPGHTTLVEVLLWEGDIDAA